MLLGFKVFGLGNTDYWGNSYSKALIKNEFKVHLFIKDEGHS